MSVTDAVQLATDNADQTTHIAVGAAVGAAVGLLVLVACSVVNPRRACAARVTVVVLCVCVCVCVSVCPGRSSATHATKRQTRHTHGLSILVAPE